jgi:Crinkler effector protein N-terminal domain
MVKLFCSIVGEKGSAFAIEVDENTMVDAMKDAIKKEKENDLKAIDVDKLKLFLGKASDVTCWIQALKMFRSSRKGERLISLKC